MFLDHTINCSYCSTDPAQSLFQQRPPNLLWLLLHAIILIPSFSAKKSTEKGSQKFKSLADWKEQAVQAVHNFSCALLTCESGEHNLSRTVESMAPHADFAALAPRAAASSWRGLISVPPASTFLFLFFFSSRSSLWLVFQRVFEGAAADASNDAAGFYNLRVFPSAIGSCKTHKP